jgi:hypothetical protein
MGIVAERSGVNRVRDPHEGQTVTYETNDRLRLRRKIGRVCSAAVVHESLQKVYYRGSKRYFSSHGHDDGSNAFYICLCFLQKVSFAKSDELECGMIVIHCIFILMSPCHIFIVLIQHCQYRWAAVS